MPTQIVMNRNGDTRHYFDANDAAALAKAEERFKELTGEGFTAAVRIKPGEIARITTRQRAGRCSAHTRNAGARCSRRCLCVPMR